MTAPGPVTDQFMAWFEVNCFVCPPYRVTAAGLIDTSGISVTVAEANFV